ncbi:MAG: HDOD domain-containing protein [Phycisphaerae bacterium]|nr:HDOD domain-containing protein [Phycisphaerae bacterium]
MERAVTIEATESQERLRQLVEHISDVATLPAVFAKIMEVVNEPEACAADLKAVVECDPALTSRVLKRVNSAYFGLPTRIGSLQTAISLLGFNAVRNLALTVSVSDLFKDDVQVHTYSRLGLWKHMVSAAICARMIARRTSMAQFEDAYLGGLLHDIGIVFFDQHAPESFRKTLAQLSEERELRFCERDVVGFDHAELGSAVAEKWRFPELIVQCVRWHHFVPRCPETARKVTATVELANFLCTQKGAGAVCLKYKPRLRSNLLAELGLSRDDLRVLWEDMDKELESARDLLNL